MTSSARNGKPSDQDARPPREWVAACFDRLQSALVAYSRQQLRGDLDAARDVVQEAFVRLCQQRWPEIESHATAWLYRTCRNRAIDIARREGRMNKIQSTADVATVQDRSRTRPDDQVASQEQLDRVQARIGLLPDLQQELLRLRLRDGLSYKQIAEVTGLTAANVGYHLHQAIATLRAAVGAR